MNQKANNQSNLSNLPLKVDNSYNLEINNVRQAYKHSFVVLGNYNLINLLQKHLF